MYKLLKTVFLGLGLLIGTSCSVQEVNQTERKFDRLELRNEVSRHVVKVMGLNGGHGSGFSLIHGDRNYIITNAHVCGMAEKGYILVQYAYSTHRYLAKVHKVDDVHDLCAIKSVRGIISQGLRVARRSPEVGTILHSMGYPKGNNVTMSSGEYTGLKDIQLQAEMINGKCLGELKKYETFFGEVEVCVKTFPSYELTAAVYPGSSGSALFNDVGEVVGVIFAKSNETHISNYAVPLDYLKTFLRKL